MDDENPNMPFSHDKDFEGGQWINGEFYGRARSRQNTQTKEDAIYGTFMGGSSDDEPRRGLGGGRGGGRGKRKGGIKETFQPIKFLGSGFQAIDSLESGFR